MAIEGKVKAVGIGPITEANRQLRKKRLVTGPFRSDDWSKIPAQLRNAAQFSAGIENSKTMAAIQKHLQKALDAPADESYMDRSKFVSEMRQALRAPEAVHGKPSKTDISTTMRYEPGTRHREIVTGQAIEFGFVWPSTA